jgi:hypothetical protein
MLLSMNCSFIAVRLCRYRGNRNGRQFFFMPRSLYRRDQAQKTALACL